MTLDYPVVGSAPWDPDLEAKIDGEDQETRDEIAAIPGTEPSILDGILEAAIAREALQLGDGATKDVGEEFGTLMAGDDPRVLGAVQADQNGAEFTTDKARLKVANNSAQGDDPVEGHGPQGDVKAQGFRVYDKGDTLIFTGNADVVLKGAHPNPGAAPPPPAVPPRIAGQAAAVETAARPALAAAAKAEAAKKPVHLAAHHPPPRRHVAAHHPARHVPAKKAGAT